MNEELLLAIKERNATDRFNQGILTADKYVATLMQKCGTDQCYRYGCNGNTSFNDVFVKSTSKLTYTDNDLQVEDVYLDVKSKVSDLILPSGMDLELPKNTLMVFKHGYSTPRKDRDGDTLRSEGADLDPNMLMLWQHVHTMPIGKLFYVARQDRKGIDVVSVIVDMGDLSKDACVMVENKMARFSHGFKAKEFEKIKGGGFDVTKWEGLEESIVSVPANIDAEVQDVYLSLIEGGKMTSGIMKQFGASIREEMPLQMATGIDIKKLEEPNHEDEPTTTKGKGKGCSCGGKCPKCASEQKDDDASGRKEQEGDSEHKEMMCPECGGKMENGTCKKCGYSKKDTETDEKSIDEDLISDDPEEDELYPGDDVEMFDFEDFDKEFSDMDIKAGRVLSKSNYEKLIDIQSDLDEMDRSQLLTTRTAQALCKSVMGKLKSVIDTANPVELPKETVEITVKEAMAIVLAEADGADRNRMIKALHSLNEIDEIKLRTKSLKACLS